MSEFEHTASPVSADELVAESAEQWQSQLLAAIDDHFARAHQRVDLAYRQHFASLRAVLGRHWQYRRDVPSDLLAAPRALWHTDGSPRTARTLGRRSVHRMRRATSSASVCTQASIQIEKQVNNKKNERNQVHTAISYSKNYKSFY